MNFGLAEYIKCLPKGHNTLAPGESRTIGPSDTSLDYIGDLQLILFKLGEVPRVRYTTT